MEIISQNNTATNTTAIEFAFSAEEFENAIAAAYNKRKKNISVPGFRKGKAPRKVIEAQYGEACTTRILPQLLKSPVLMLLTLRTPRSLT